MKLDGSDFKLCYDTGRYTGNIIDSRVSFEISSETSTLYFYSNFWSYAGYQFTAMKLNNDGTVGSLGLVEAGSPFAQASPLFGSPDSPEVMYLDVGQFGGARLGSVDVNSPVVAGDVCGLTTPFNTIVDKGLGAFAILKMNVLVPGKSGFVTMSNLSGTNAVSLHSIDLETGETTLLMPTTCSKTIYDAHNNCGQFSVNKEKTKLYCMMQPQFGMGSPVYITVMDLVNKSSVDCKKDVKRASVTMNKLSRQFHFVILIFSFL